MNMDAARPNMLSPQHLKLNNQTDSSSCWSSGAKSAWAVLWQSKSSLSWMIDIEPATTLVDEPPQKSTEENIHEYPHQEPFSWTWGDAPIPYTALQSSATWDSTSQKQIEGIGPKFCPPRLAIQVVIGKVISWPKRRKFWKYPLNTWQTYYNCWTSTRRCCFFYG